MIFFILKYIFIALFLAYFTQVLSKKKEVMLGVKKQVLERRLALYASLYKVLHRNSTLIAPPAADEQYYWSMMGGMPFHIGDQKMEYVSYFHSYERFNEYSLQIQQMCSKKVFLPKEIEDELKMVAEWFLTISDFLGAFKKVEEEKRPFSDELRSEHLDLACQMCGIALQYDIEFVSSHLKSILAARLRMPSLLNLFEVSIINKCKLWSFKRNFKKLDLYEHTPSIILLLIFVHISNVYTRDEFDKLPENKRETIMQEFHSSYVKYLPHA